MRERVLHRLEHTVGKAQYRALTAVAGRFAGVRAEAVTVDGVRVPYLFRPSEDGAPPVALVHGFGSDKENWLLMAGFLRRGRGLVIPDLPGYGAAGSIPKERAAARHQSEALARVLERAGARRAHLVGNSMGGGVSLRFAQDLPERAASLTLIGSVGPIVEKSEVGVAIDRGENPLVTRSPDDMDRLVRLVAERVPPSTRAMRRYLGIEHFKRTPSLALLFDGWLNPAAGDGVPTELEAIATPTLVIHGGKDRVIHPSTGRALADRLGRARLEPMADLGHVPQLEAPKRVAGAIEAFLASLRA